MVEIDKEVFQSGYFQRRSAIWGNTDLIITVSRMESIVDGYKKRRSLKRGANFVRKTFNWGHLRVVTWMKREVKRKKMTKRQKRENLLEELEGLKKEEDLIGTPHGRSSREFCWHQNGNTNYKVKRPETTSKGEEKAVGGPKC